MELLCFAAEFSYPLCIHAHEIIPGYTLQSFLFLQGSTMFDQNRFWADLGQYVQGERHCLASSSVFTIRLFTYRCVPHK